MSDIGIVASSAYVPIASRSLPQLLATRRTEPATRRARFINACFEENLQMHGISMAAMDTARARLAAGTIERCTGVSAVAEEASMEVSEMLLRVTRELLHPGSEAPVPQVDTFVVCQTCLENDVTVSAACRLQAELRQGQVPFAIGQLQGATFLLGLSIAADLLSTGTEGQVVVAAAERWTQPYTRLLGTTAVLGDGAGAVLLQRGCRSGWLLRAIRVVTPPPVGEVYRHLLNEAPLGPDLDGLCALVSETLRDAQCLPRDIDVLVPHDMCRDLTSRLRRRCGLRSAWRGPADILDGGYLCSAEAPVRMHRLLQHATARAGDRMLLWGAGFEGALACAVLEFADEEPPHASH